MRRTLERLLEGRDLDESEAGDLLLALTDPELPQATKGALLVALRAKGETAAEVRGMARAMRQAARPLSVARDRLIDTCGTGGDGSSSINVSTAAALVLAAGGAAVVKHGNRSVSSRSGSADVLEALGITLPTGPQEAEALLDRAGFTFLFAPHFHPATAAVVPVRRALGVRTVFNLLGPLTNPAAPRFQVLGAYDPEACALLADAISGLPIERVFVVHGAPGWDEATPCGPFALWDVRPGRVEHRVVDPAEDYGVDRCDPDALSGGDADDNAGHLRALFEGQPGPHRDAVLLNAALGLELLGEATGRDALALAGSIVDDGRVLELLERLR